MGSTKIKAQGQSHMTSIFMCFFKERKHYKTITYDNDDELIFSFLVAPLKLVQYVRIKKNILT